MTTSENGYYLIRNICNNMVYVGGTKYPFEKRWKEHRYHLRKGDHTNKPFQEDWNKYGEFSFNFEIIEREYTGTKRETELILLHVSNCYNYDFPTQVDRKEFDKLSFRKPVKNGITGEILRGEL